MDKRTGRYMAHDGQGSERIKGENGEVEESKQGLYTMAWCGGSVPVYVKVLACDNTSERKRMDLGEMGE